jgi:hypothetical protein
LLLSFSSYLILRIWNNFEGFFFCLAIIIYDFVVHSSDET